MIENLGIAHAGLVIIIIAWIIQLMAVLKKNKEIKQEFVIGYAMGVALLVIDGFMNNLTMLASLNLICIVVSIAVLIKLK